MHELRFISLSIGNPTVSIKLGTDVIHVIKLTRPSLHTASDQELDDEKAWEQD